MRLIRYRYHTRYYGYSTEDRGNDLQ
eukprot:SAG31_NODE_19327_length_605_cov_308.156126_1_plen_25_part_01